MSTVTLNGSRLNNADAATGWGNFNTAGPSPAAEAQLRYQGTNAVNKKITSTTSRQGVEYAHGSTTDMTSASFPLLLAKMKVGDAGDLNATYGCEIGIGSDGSNFYSYNVSGSGANNDQYTAGYNSQGGLAEGYIITAINPNVSQWREATTGTPALGSVDYFAFGAQFVTGGAKSENVAADAVDVGVGLDYNGTSFTFDDGADTDQDNTSNRWGFACRNGNVLTFRGRHRAGNSSATSGTDSTTVLFPDGYHGTGDCGIDIDLSNASTSITLAGTYSGLGRIYSSDDTRPDFIATSTNGALTISGRLANWNAITLTSACTVTGDIECADLTQASAEFDGAVLRCDSASGVAVCNDPTFGTGGIHDTAIVQSGSGHAFEITTPGTYSLNGLTYSGFGADGTNSAAIYNNSGGAVTLNIVGGGTPTVRNGAGASTTVSNSVNITLTGLVAGSTVYVYNTTDSVELFKQVEATTTFNQSVNYTADKSLLIRVRKHSVSPYYKDFETTGTLTSSGFSLTVNQEVDE